MSLKKRSFEFDPGNSNSNVFMTLNPKILEHLMKSVSPQQNKFSPAKFLKTQSWPFLEEVGNLKIMVVVATLCV